MAYTHAHDHTHDSVEVYLEVTGRLKSGGPHQHNHLHTHWNSAAEAHAYGFVYDEEDEPHGEEGHDDLSPEQYEAMQTMVSGGGLEECREPSCREIASALNRCPVHAKKWFVIRQRVLGRDSHRCTYCGSLSDLAVDHIVPVAKGGKSNLDNLTTACRSCNSSKHVKDVGEFLGAGVR